mgnify:CR=1 FL=1
MAANNSQPNNSYYCKYGSTTKFGCGFVVANNFSPSYVPNASATFMRLYMAANYIVSGLSLSILTT